MIVMGITAQQVADLVDMLPNDDQQLALELVKKLVLAWDPDYTKATPAEEEELKQTEERFEKGEYTDFNDVDWN